MLKATQNVCFNLRRNESAEKSPWSFWAYFCSMMLNFIMCFFKSLLAKGKEADALLAAR